MKPFPHFSLPDSINEEIGKELLQRGKVGAIILAGGQATRLGLDAPKGTMPVSAVQGKSLFQLFAEKTIACSKQVGKDLPLAIMTSSLNDTATKTFFHERENFGLHNNNLFFFQQGNLHFLDEKTHAPLEESGPNGNGSLFWNFAEIAQEWKRRGIEYVTISLIDNALADPWNKKLLALHALSHNDVTIIAVEKTHPDEKVGLIVEDAHGKVGVVGYTEMGEGDKERRDSDGRLSYRLANISTFCFSLDFMLEMAARPIEVMPLHTQRKYSKTMEKWIVKLEYFIFDALQFATHPGVLLLKREDVFAPLKNKEGADSKETVQQALLKRDRRMYEEISGVEVEAGKVFELGVEFLYPTRELRARFLGQSLPDGPYIT